MGHHDPPLCGFELHSAAMNRIYVKVMLFEVVQLALLWWLQRAFL